MSLNEIWEWINNEINVIEDDKDVHYVWGIIDALWKMDHITYTERAEYLAQVELKRLKYGQE